MAKKINFSSGAVAAQQSKEQQPGTREEQKSKELLVSLSGLAVDRYVQIDG